MLEIYDTWGRHTVWHSVETWIYIKTGVIFGEKVWSPSQHEEMGQSW